MSLASPSTKPYKSRLLNFVNRNYIKFSSRAKRKFRELSYGVRGGLLQAIISPFLWLWQTVSNSHNNLKGGKEAKIFLNSSQGDKLIKKVNQTLVLKEDLPLLVTSQFQGLASDVKGKHILIVLRNNQCHDIISADRQSKIIQLINDDIRDYEKRNYPNPFLLLVDRLISGVENLVIRENNFSVTEEKINNSPGDNPKKSHIFNIPLLSLIKSAIDYFFGINSPVRILGENQDTPENQVSSISRKEVDNLPFNREIKQIFESSQDKIKQVLPVVKTQTEKVIHQGVNQMTVLTETMINKFDSKNDPFSITILILAALNYFFQGKQKKGINNQSNISLFSAFTTETIILENPSSNFWLSWDDLFGECVYSLRINELSSEMVTLSSPSIVNNFTDNVDNISNVTSNQSTKETVITKDNYHQSQENNFQDIEVKVIEIKYEKHLLEIILEKLDELILWLEEFIIRLIRWIKMLWLNFKGEKS